MRNIDKSEQGDTQAADDGGTDRRQQQRRERDLRRHTETDSLTGLRNQKYVIRILSGNRHRRDRRRRSFVSMIGIDDLVNIRKEAGHCAADEIIRAIGRHLDDRSESAGFAARWDEDAFLVVRSCADELEAWLWTESIRREVSAIVAGAVMASAGMVCVETQQLTLRTPEWADHALSLARAAGGGRVCTWPMVQVESMAGELQMRGDLSLETRREMLLKRMGNLLGDAQRSHVHRHCIEVSSMGVRLAEALGLSEHWIETIRMAGLFHDIGKCVIPESILSKPTTLSGMEWEVLRRHGEFGAHLAAMLGASDDVVDVIERHQELSASSGLARIADISPVVQAARVLSLADAMCAMRVSRPYRPAMGRDEMLQALRGVCVGHMDVVTTRAVERVSAEAWSTAA